MTQNNLCGCFVRITNIILYIHHRICCCWISEIPSSCFHLLCVHLFPLTKQTICQSTHLKINSYSFIFTYKSSSNNSFWKLVRIKWNEEIHRWMLSIRDRWRVFRCFFCFVFKLASFNANWNVLTNLKWVNSMAWVIFHDRSIGMMLDAIKVNFICN